MSKAKRPITLTAADLIGVYPKYCDVKGCKSEAACELDAQARVTGYDLYFYLCTSCKDKLLEGLLIDFDSHLISLNKKTIKELKESGW